MIKETFVLLLFSMLCACNPMVDNDTASLPSQTEQKPTPRHLITEISIYNEVHQIQAVIEIPAGSDEKWEVNKTSGVLERDSIDGQPRTIHYIGYPANYGFIPQTLLSKDDGGDGDPLDAVVLGKPQARGSIVGCSVLGILTLKDNGEQDDKLILAAVNSQFANCSNLTEIKANYPGLLTALESWFTHYKGPDIMKSEGYQGQSVAESMIIKAHKQYKKQSP